MNRPVVALLSVLIVLVAVNGFLVWRSGEQAQEDAARQACIDRTEATAILGLMVPALITPAEEIDRESQVRSLESLSAQLDDC